HALHHQWVVSVFDQEGREPMPQVVKPESRAILRNDSGSHRRRSDVVLHDHTAESRLFPMQLGRREHEVRVLVEWSLLTPHLQQSSKRLVHLYRSLGCHGLWTSQFAINPVAPDVDLQFLPINI